MSYMRPSTVRLYRLLIAIICSCCVAADAAVIDAAAKIDRNTTDCGFVVPPELKSRYPWAAPRHDKSGFFCSAQNSFKLERDKAVARRAECLAINTDATGLGGAAATQSQGGIIQQQQPDSVSTLLPATQTSSAVNAITKLPTTATATGDNMQPMEGGGAAKAATAVDVATIDKPAAPKTVSSGMATPAPTPAPMPRFQEPGYGLVLYGDSVIQCFKWPFKVCNGAPEVMNKYLGRYRPAVWALGNDKTPSLLWRMMQGVAPTGTGARASVVLIGMNDLSDWEYSELDRAPEVIGSRLVDIAEYLADAQPGMDVVMLGMLPRGGGGTGTEWPNWNTATIQAINEIVELGLEDLALYRANQTNSFHFLDCGPLLLTPVPREPGNYTLPKRIMQDGMHLSAEGFDVLLGECLAPLMEDIFGY